MEWKIPKLSNAICNFVKGMILDLAFNGDLYYEELCRESRSPKIELRHNIETLGFEIGIATSVEELIKSEDFRHLLCDSAEMPRSKSDHEFERKVWGIISSLGFVLHHLHDDCTDDIVGKFAQIILDFHAAEGE